MLRNADTTIGVDVGGTSIRAARISADGEILAHVKEPVSGQRDAFANQLLRLIAQMQDKTTKAVGVGIPGRVDAPNSQIVSAGYLDIAGLDVPALIAEHTGLPARVENDATMALIAECNARENCSEGLILMITIGTGIGGAAVQDGTPWYGGGFSGQFGHIVVSPDGPACNCGSYGCVETFSSGTALGKLTAAAGLSAAVNGAELIARADAGDVLCTTILDTWALPLMRTARTLMAVANPKLIVLGGGLGVEMAQSLERRRIASQWFELPIEAAVLGDAAGVVGAGLRVQCWSENKGVF